MRSSPPAKILLLLVSLFFTAGLLETVARVWLRHYSSPEEFLRYASLRDLDEEHLAVGRAGSERRYTPHRYLGYIPTPGYRNHLNRHNALGYRGDEIAVPKPKGEFRIACLGGSTTYEGRIADYRSAYPQLLEAELHERGYRAVRVVNAGAESYTSWESLINLELRVLDLEPDLVIDYDGINDVHARLVWPPETYRGDNSGRRAPNAASIVMPSVFEHSALLRILLVRSGLALPHSDLAKTIDRAPTSFQAPRFWSQSEWLAHPAELQASADAMLDANPPIYFRRNLASIVAVSRAHGADVVLATYAFTTTHDDDPTGTSPPYIRAIGEMNETMKAVARETGAHLFDFGALFPDDRRYWADGEHVNVRGSGLKARLFADYLLANQLVPESGLGKQ